MERELKDLINGVTMLHFEGELQCAERILAELGEPYALIDDVDAVYENMTVRKYLEYFAGLLGGNKLIPSALEQMHLADIQKKKTAGCTPGEKRRLAVAREILKDAGCYFLINPLEGMDGDTQKIILSWMDSFQGGSRRLITLSQSHRYTCLCPGDHYEMVGEEMHCIDQNEVTEENPDLPSINKISVIYNEKIFLFNPEEIDYVEANDGQVLVYVQGEQYQGAFKMAEIEERLTRFGFFRSHRSYLVNMQKVVELVKWTRNSFSLKIAGYDKIDIPLSKAKIQELKSMYEF